MKRTSDRQRHNFIEAFGHVVLFLLICLLSGGCESTTCEHGDRIFKNMIISADTYKSGQMENG